MFLEQAHDAAEHREVRLVHESAHGRARECPARAEDMQCDGNRDEGVQKREARQGDGEQTGHDARRGDHVGDQVLAVGDERERPGAASGANQVAAQRRVHDGHPAEEDEAQVEAL